MHYNTFAKICGTFAYLLNISGLLLDIFYIFCYICLEFLKFVANFATVLITWTITNPFGRRNIRAQGHYNKQYNGAGSKEVIVRTTVFIAFATEVFDFQTVVFFIFLCLFYWNFPKLKNTNYIKLKLVEVIFADVVFVVSILVKTVIVETIFMEIIFEEVVSVEIILVKVIIVVKVVFAEVFL